MPTRRFAALLCGALVALWGSAKPASGQVIRGVLRSQDVARNIERARVTAQDTAGRLLGEAQSDESGKFTLVLNARGAPFTLLVRRIGIEPSSSTPLTLSPADTVDVELTIPERPLIGDTIRVIGAPSLNESRYREAVRRGWFVFPPAEVEKHREQARDVYDLLRWSGANSLVIPGRTSDCVRNMRYLAGDRRSERCMVWVVDGVVLGPTPVLNPRDTYFIAILSGSESTLQFGDKAPWGAIVLYTRMHGDPLHP